MSKSKKDTNKENAEIQNSPKQTGRRQFLRKAGVAGVAAVAAASLTPLAKAQDSNKVSLNVQLDAEKVQAIQKCLAKGTLRISMSKADASTGETKTDPWLYD
jgi:hypothetical protein